MTRLLLIPILLLLLPACHRQSSPVFQRASIHEEIPKASVFGDTVPVDLSHSQISWKGTKLRKTGQHKGIVQLVEAYLLIEGDQLTGGNFTVDMNTIEVTDIPEHDPIPRERLKNHLESRDFFHSAKYPYSHFEITAVTPMPADSLSISGNLSIKDVTRNIQFTALFKNRVFATRFTFDRFQWNIAYEGSWHNKTLVDKDIELTIHLEAR